MAIAQIILGLPQANTTKDWIRNNLFATMRGALGSDEDQNRAELTKGARI